MLRMLSFVLMAMVLALPVRAGTLVVQEGQLQWSSSECQSPLPPESVLNADREARARYMNGLVMKHNDYVAQVQTYMDCLSAEAKRDADKASQDIIDSAQTKIIEAQSTVEEASSPLRGKEIE